MIETLTLNDVYQIHFHKILKLLDDLAELEREVGKAYQSARDLPNAKEMAIRVTPATSEAGAPIRS